MNLILPPRVTDSAARIRDAARARGLGTVRLESFAVPDGLRAAHLHAGPGFADAVAPQLGIGLLEAPAHWLARLPREFTGREVRLVPIREAYALRRPVFVKSPNDKSIPALVYADGSRLPGPDAVDPETEVLVSDVARFTAEYRTYLLDGAVHTASRYAADGRLSLGPAVREAVAFAERLPFATLPSAIVVDVGVSEGRWSVIEANAAWASGTYVCDPQRALDVVLRAAAPLDSVADRDKGFLR
ncbi:MULTISPECIES: ATP-grasp domain-containing protein [unclassified Streptomyces]|uniref:ATP-grasp domain-containing protein n=1 Tax=unclassified Streptomyces TaxID=2593676 RepID=UPI002E12B820|nr:MULTISPECIES: ATP-grasp domain-containing protein [unclassified Streptomyces]WSR22696.1 ATP-grasp domain-containing protein [Streptomyces sp. NBC_01205]